ncbi:MAG TPA: carboxypeptidase regulatory-like domain-containing protein, partial [Thermoanaerobaculia bacterium]|nr:carboxypeptidase regulatory-like domain-containing protein [Thermoanaerobaculia bacterium]
MRVFFRFTALMALLLLVGLPAVAQTTASLTGTATTGGGPLPGVTVTVSSPQMQGTRTTVTGDNGGYSFAALPPGDFDVKFELQGMATQTKHVRVGIGQQGRADADLKVSAVTEAITVTAGAPSVLETATVSANVQQKLINQLPVNRTPLNAALLAPGVNSNTAAGGQLSISGSPGYDNLVMVNGVAVTEEVRHQDLNLYIEDAIQETTVMTGAISAEYGGFTGGVVNSISKSGGNNFSGTLRDTITNPLWTSLTPLQKTNKFQRVNDRANVYEETLGGYVLRDRLWFFGAGRQAKTSATSALTSVPLGDATRASVGFTSPTDEKRYEGKLTFSPFTKVNVVGSYLDFSRKAENTVFTTASYDLAQLSPRSDPRKLKSVHADAVVTNNWMLEGLWSKMWWGVAWGNGSQFTDFINGTIVRNRADGNNRYNSATFCGVCDKETRSNDGYNFKSHYFLSNKGIGDHDIVVGGERFAEHRFANNYQSGSNFRVFANSAQRFSDVIYSTFNPGKAAASAFLQWTPIFTLQQNESDLASDALFVNDRWNLNDHWNFGVGFRYDKNDATDASGNKVAKDARLSPRLNTTYDIKGDGRHRLTASFGH